MTKITEKLTKKLKGVEKTPKWHFIAKRVMIWSVLVLAIILGAIAFSMILFQLINADWDIHLHRPGQGMIGSFCSLIPYFWIVTAGFLMIFVYFDFKQTKSGYKKKAAVVIGTSVGVSIILGTIFYSIHFSERLEDKFEHIHIYQQLHGPRYEIWIAPEDGYLGGIVLTPEENQRFDLKDLNGKIWHINTHFAERKCELNIKEKMKLKLLGEQTNENEFTPIEIRPWLAKPKAQPKPNGLSL